MERPKMQVALDFTDRKKAVETAKKVAQNVDWIEAGTPLIKSCGIGIVGILKKKFPRKEIVADMKTMDTGFLETELAAKAGADIVCVLGAAEDETIKGAVEAGRKYGIKIAVDLIGVKNPLKRAKDAERLGADYVILHTGIDSQARKGIAFPVLMKISSSVKIPVIAAGGIDRNSAKKALEAGATVIVVGGAITRAPNPAEASREIRKQMF